MTKNQTIRELLAAEEDIVEAIHCFIKDFMGGHISEQTAIETIRFITDNSKIIWEACA